MSDVLKYILILSSAAVVSEILYTIRRYWNKKERKKSCDQSDSVGLFFPDYALCCPYVHREDFHSKPISFSPPGVRCRFDGCRFVHLPEDVSPKRFSSFQTMCRTLSSAKKSIDVCLWVFSLEFLAKLLVHMQNKKGVKVRVVIDSREDETDKTKISYLRSQGVAVRFAPQLVNSGMFHHKFAIVDSSTVLFGSMNWTMSAVRKNLENVCITSRPLLVRPFVDRFQYYWDTFSAEPTNKRRVLLPNQS